LVSVISQNLAGTWLILDTWTSKLTVFNPNPLHDMKPVKKNMKTYSGAIDITHMVQWHLVSITSFQSTTLQLENVT
jgi:hypothetical protein